MNAQLATSDHDEKITAWQIAGQVASLIKDHPGESARGLFRLYLDRFAAVNCDGHKAAGMIRQHLNRLKDRSLVEEVPGGVKNSPKNPIRWRWVDGAEADGPVARPDPLTAALAPLRRSDEPAPAEEDTPLSTVEEAADEPAPGSESAAGRGLNPVPHASFCATGTLGGVRFSFECRSDGGRAARMMLRFLQALAPAE